MPERSISFDTFNSFVADPMELTTIKEALDSIKLPVAPPAHLRETPPSLSPTKFKDFVIFTTLLSE